MTKKSLSNLVRKNIRMSEELASWYEKKASELGVSQSNLMVMALDFYVRQDKAMSNMDELRRFIKMYEDSGFMNSLPEKK